MGRVWWALTASLALSLGGCGGGDGDAAAPGMIRATPPDELPVACVTKLGRGDCPPGTGKFYYDYRDNRCKPTSPAGCAGRSLFDSLQTCVRYCGAR